MDALLSNIQSTSDLVTSNDQDVLRFSHLKTDTRFLSNEYHQLT